MAVKGKTLLSTRRLTKEKLSKKNIRTTDWPSAHLALTLSLSAVVLVVCLLSKQNNPETEKLSW